VLSTLSQETHAASDSSTFGVEAFAEGASAIQAGMHGAGLQKLEHLLVKYLPLHLQPLGMEGFELLLPSLIRTATDAFLSSRQPHTTHALPFLVRACSATAGYLCVTVVAQLFIFDSKLLRNVSLQASHSLSIAA
jgi:hypothetical protein